MSLSLLHPAALALLLLPLLAVAVLMTVGSTVMILRAPRPIPRLPWPC